MKVEFINPFVTAAYKVLEHEAKTSVRRGELSIEKTAVTSEDVTILIGIVGGVEGMVLYGMKEKTAKAIASAMLNQQVLLFDEMAESALAEMGNIISGLATIDLEKAGYTCQLSPPTVVYGRNTMISTVKIARLIVPVHTDHGTITIHVALSETGKG